MSGNDWLYHARDSRDQSSGCANRPTHNEGTTQNQTAFCRPRDVGRQKRILKPADDGIMNQVNSICVVAEAIEDWTRPASISEKQSEECYTCRSATDDETEISKRL